MHDYLPKSVLQYFWSKVKALVAPLEAAAAEAAAAAAEAAAAAAEAAAVAAEVRTSLSAYVQKSEMQRITNTDIDDITAEEEEPEL